MNALQKLSIKNLKLNKKRTISTIIGIILAVSLICGLCTIVTSFKATLVENAIQEAGYYHINIKNLSKTDIEDLKLNRDISKIIEITECGYSILEKSENEYKPYARVFSVDKSGFDELKFRLIEGSFPKNSNEIVISKHMKSNGGMDYKIGDTLNLNIGKRYSLDGDEIEGNPLLLEEDEELRDTKNYTFKIVGIIERPVYTFEDYSECGYTMITTGITGNDVNAYIALKNPNDYENSIAEIMGVSDYEDILSDEARFDDFDINDELLRLEVFKLSDSTFSMLIIVSSVILIIIMVTSVFCIRNSFAIAVTEKLKMYGMLASIGATKKQIKKNVIFEALILGIIGIPLGVLSGIFAIWVLLKVVSSIIGKYLFAYVNGFVFDFSWIAILISVILGLITIYLSAISSARKASKVDPIKLLRNSGDIKIKAKKLKVPIVIEKIFKTGGVLAYKNLKRSKKKYRTTVISIAVSVFVFICMSAFLDKGMSYTNLYYTDYSYNINVYGIFDRENNEEIFKQILNLDNIDESYVTYNIKENFVIEDFSYVNTKYNYYDEMNEYDENGEIISSKEVMIPYIIGYDHETFEKYLNKAKINPKDVKGKCILIDECNFWNEDEDTVKVDRTYKYSVNDKIVGKLGEEDFYFTVGAISNVHPYGMENSTSMSGMIILDISEFDDYLNWKASDLYISSPDASKLEEDINKLKLDVSLHNYEKIVQEQKAMILVMKIFVYGFICVITLIGVTNIFNTVTSNIEFRQKEFASLKSIGMTKKEFNRMVNLETIFYGTKALIYGIIMGIIGTFFIYKAFSIKFDSGLNLPWEAIGICAISVYLLVFIVMRYSIGKVNKHNIIDTIRNDNI
ncbi:MAG: ABC transporter permease [Clostridia bacterium]|nr:ABC transporter permease [Clostridia bacterium]